MKYLHIVIFAYILTVPVAFALPELPRDGQGQKIQAFAPDMSKTSFLTVYSTLINISNDLRWNVYTPTACKFRVLSSATKIGTALTLPANSFTEQVINRNSSVYKFFNSTGCANAELKRQ